MRTERRKCPRRELLRKPTAIQRTVSSAHIRFYSQKVVFNSPPGIAVPPTGLCFSDVTFFFLNVAPVILQRMDGSQR